MGMTKRDLWLKLFSENDTALASAIHLCERFITTEQLENGEDFINQKRKELYLEVPKEVIEEIFGTEKYEKISELEKGRLVNSKIITGNCKGCKNDNTEECLHCMRAYSDCYELITDRRKNL